MSFAWQNKIAKSLLIIKARAVLGCGYQPQRVFQITKADEKGYRIFKDIIPIQQKVKGEWHVGDVMRVELSFTSAKKWVGWWLMIPFLQAQCCWDVV